jgi:hypothetical protein
MSLQVDLAHLMIKIGVAMDFDAETALSNSGNAKKMTFLTEHVMMYSHNSNSNQFNLLRKDKI